MLLGVFKIILNESKRIKDYFYHNIGLDNKYYNLSTLKITYDCFFFLITIVGILYLAGLYYLRYFRLV